MNSSNLQDILNSTSISMDTLLNTLCKQFHAIYLLDLTQDKIFSICDYHAEKLPEETDDTACTKDCKTYLEQFIHTTIHKNYHAYALKFFNFETILLICRSLTPITLLNSILLILWFFLIWYSIIFSRHSNMFVFSISS